jgi:hypothetical protein
MLPCIVYVLHFLILVRYGYDLSADSKISWAQDKKDEAMLMSEEARCMGY